MSLLPKPNNNIIIIFIYRESHKLKLALGGFQVSQNLRIPALNKLHY